MLIFSLFLILLEVHFCDSLLHLGVHKGGMRIGKTPKKLDSICCPQRRETKADTLKQLRSIGKGDQELEKT
jgi:hypothetical protein